MCGLHSVYHIKFTYSSLWDRSEYLPSLNIVILNNESLINGREKIFKNMFNQLMIKLSNLKKNDLLIFNCEVILAI